MQFNKIIGQDAVKKRLIHTVNEQRISHAQLFYGPEGSGKLALAIAYAQYLNCENRQAEDSCGVCPSCNKYEKLIHPDLHFIYPVAATKDVPSKPMSINFLPAWREFLFKNEFYVSLKDWYDEIEIEKKQGIINKDDCNNIITTLSYKSYEAEYKVMIIWMVEKLFHAAAPKILKILEEPPDKTLFILITENHDQILPTIISRTQLVKVPRIEESQLLESLSGTSQYAPADLRKAVMAGNGNYNETTRYLEKKEDEEFNFTQFRDWMRLCFKPEMIKLIGFSENMAKLGRETQKNFFLYALKMIQFSLSVPYHKSNFHKLEGGEATFANKFSPFIKASNAYKFMEELNKAFYHIERNANANILFLDLSIKFSTFLNEKPGAVS